MTNLDVRPQEMRCADVPASADEGIPAVEVLLPRDVPLGGVRAMTVRRTLPQRRRSVIGAWCFADHYGPDDVEVTGGMRVPPHPHTGLQTVSWLFSGAVEHRDSLGTHVVVRPGEMNLMTAGHGISHSEDSTADTRVLHGVQLWTVLPEKDRDVEPRFDHHVPGPTSVPGGELRVFLGALAGVVSPVPTYSPLLGAELTLEAGAAVTFHVDPSFEPGVLVDHGGVTLVPEESADGRVPQQSPDGTVSPDGTLSAVEPTLVTSGQLAYTAPGAATLTLRASDDGPARMLLIGGAPLGEQIVMWWNFIGRDHAEVMAAREAWQREIGADDAVVPAGGTNGTVRRPHGSRFGAVGGHPHPPLPAPALPNHRLKPRG